MKEPFVTPTPSSPDGGVSEEAGALDFPRSSRILRSADFRLIYDHGFRVSGPLFAAFCRAREGAAIELGARLGLTVPRAVGKAVIRNRIKRRLREVFRLHRAKIAPKWDIVLNPRRAALDAEFGQIEREMGRVIEKCNSR
ncbi:MAG TPA: ribonuclease P protein component [Bryobacteraceae bacterium]|jgi:ribonuclease P protein component